MDFDPGSSGFCDEDLLAILRELDIDLGALDGTITLDGETPVLASAHRSPEAGGLALAVQAAAISALQQLRGQAQGDVTVSLRELPFALNPFLYFRRNGRLSRHMDLVLSRPSSGHFEGIDGRHIAIAGVLPKAHENVMRFFGAPVDRDDLARTISKWDVFDLEEATTSIGIDSAVVRTPEEWRALEHGAALAKLPLFQITKHGETAPVPLPPGDRALSGVRVIDMTHVVAGPMTTRGLAEYGADVLHVMSLRPDIRDGEGLTMETLIGKRSAQIELGEPDDQRAFEELIRGADVFVQSWRPGVLARFGFPPERIAELNPNIIQLSVSCYGPGGPWAKRGGFDGLALASIGAIAQEAARDRIKASPPGVLTDTLVSFLAPALIASLLRRRAIEGGGYTVAMSLARTGMWLQSLGEVPLGTPVTTDFGTPTMRSIDSCFGPLDYVAPALTYAHGGGHLVRSPEPVGSSLPRWE